MTKNHIFKNKYFYSSIFVAFFIITEISYLLVVKYSFLKTELVGVCNALGMACENMLSVHHRGVTTSIIIIFSLLSVLICETCATFFFCRKGHFVRRSARLSFAPVLNIDCAVPYELAQ